MKKHSKDKTSLPIQKNITVEQIKKAKEILDASEVTTKKRSLLLPSGKVIPPSKPAASSPREGKHPGGRPTKLTPELALNIFMLGRKGLTDKEIAQVCFVNETTITNWKKSQEFFTSLKDAKDAADAIIERSLFERATGYEHDEEKLFVIKDEIKSKMVTKHYPPDPAAMIFWLKNRNPAKWRERIPELSNLADAMGSVLQQLRRKIEKKENPKNKKSH